jgi:hypothetical protein
VQAVRRPGMGIEENGSDQAVEWLTREEGMQLIRQALQAGPLTEDELKRVWDWAVQARVDNAALQIVLKGDICLTVEGEEIVFMTKERAEEKARCSYGGKERSHLRTT